MSYESWRATFQSSEQAARAAYQELQAALAQSGQGSDHIEIADDTPEWIKKYLRETEFKSVLELQGAYQALMASGTRGTQQGVPEDDAWMPTLEWAVKRCQALQDQGFDRVRLDVLKKTFSNAIEAHRQYPTAQEES
ncbi:hypothetical protein FE848_15445 [Marinobacter sp. 1-3A]|uniref:hypothetical protein n=1 Tax=Marinobacter sp. 1-3A TaxID=2582920 RepID=UPI0019062216|nr:hypothetical protein [Marinobacter sp. 1-3A]MBK1874620.1 hypothetical protein [Marinobacter sp. 1-3A]